jgi:hypothetical protein
VFIKVDGMSFTEMFAANDWKPFQSCSLCGLTMKRDNFTFLIVWSKVHFWGLEMGKLWRHQKVSYLCEKHYFYPRKMYENCFDLVFAENEAFWRKCKQCKSVPQNVRSIPLCKRNCTTWLFYFLRTARVIEIVIGATWRARFSDFLN